MRQKNINIQIVTRLRSNRIEDENVLSLLKLVREHNESVAYIANRIGVTPQCIYQWFAGQTRPRKIYHPRIIELAKEYERKGWMQGSF